MPSEHPDSSPRSSAIQTFTGDAPIPFDRQRAISRRSVVFPPPGGATISEETGLQASQWIDLGDYLPSPGYSGEVIRAYLAMDLDEGEPHTDEDEFLVPVTIPVSQALDLVMSGAISDGKTAFALLKAARYLGL